MNDASTPNHQPQPLYRLLRVLEYTGTREFIDEHLERRTVKGTRLSKHGTIREAVLGDTAEILDDSSTRKENTIAANVVDLFHALGDVQDWDGTRVGDCMDALNTALHGEDGYQL